MLIDILFVLMMAMAVYKGLKNGLIVAIFSIIGWILGLMAAFRFSDAAADYLKGSVNLSPRVLSIVAFMLVFILVVFIVSLGAKVIEKTIELALMGWINRLGGIFFYVLLYTLIFSVMIFFAEKFKLLNEETTSSSMVYPLVKPIAQIIQQPILH